MALVEIIQLGFHGFAFALFYLSYKRFGDISNTPIPVDIPTDQLKIRVDLKQSFLKTLVRFMTFSVMFFVFGVTAQIVSGNIMQNITLNVHPGITIVNKEEEKILPKVIKSGINEPITVGLDGRYSIKVTDKDHITVSIDDLIRYLEQIEIKNSLEEFGTDNDLVGG